MKTVYLHIGTQKTGTTAIQFFLSGNRDLLAKKNYCFRKMPFATYDHVRQIRNGHFLIERVYDQHGKLDNEAMKKRRQEGLSYVKEWLKDFDNIILSEESIWNKMRGKDIAVLREIKDMLDELGAKLKIVVYIRPQDEFLNSWWKQHTKYGGSIEEWEQVKKNPPEKIVLDYNQNLRRIEEIVGVENMIVRLFNRDHLKGPGGTIYSDFLDAIGLTMDESFEIARQTSNDSMTNNYAQIKRILNRLPANDNAIRHYKSDFSAYFGNVATFCSAVSPAKDRYSSFSQQEREQFYQNYESGNQEILLKYFPDRDILFPQENITKPNWEKNNEEMIEDVILLFGQIAWEQKLLIEKQNKDIAMLQKQINKSLSIRVRNKCARLYHKICDLFRK